MTTTQGRKPRRRGGAASHADIERLQREWGLIGEDEPTARGEDTTE